MPNEPVTLDFIAAQLKRVLDEQAGIRERLDRFDVRLDTHEGLLVKLVDAVTEIASVQKEHTQLLRSHGSRLNAMDSRLAVLDSRIGLTDA